MEKNIAVKVCTRTCYLMYWFLNWTLFIVNCRIGLTWSHDILCIMYLVYFSNLKIRYYKCMRILNQSINKSGLCELIIWRAIRAHVSFTQWRLNESCKNVIPLHFRLHCLSSNLHWINNHLPMCVRSEENLCWNHCLPLFTSTLHVYNS